MRFNLTSPLWIWSAALLAVLFVGWSLFLPGAGAREVDGRPSQLNFRVVVACVLALAIPVLLAMYQRNTRRHLETEAALRDSEALYHSLVECLPQNILRKDLEGRFTFANQRFCATLGKPLAEILGKTDFDFFPTALATKYRRDDADVMQTGKTFETVEEHVPPAGHKMYVEVMKTPVYDARGALLGTQGIFWDVTTQREAQEALKASERRYRQLTEAAHDGIVVADQRGRITVFNPAAEKLFGYAAAEVVGQPLTCLMPAELQERHQCGFQRYLDTRVPHLVGRTVELAGRRKEGSEFPLEMSLSAIDLGGELQFLGSLRDLSERNRMRALLVQSEKLASLGVLSAGIAHEINNPLAFVANNLVVLENDIKGLLALLDVYEAVRPHVAAADPEADRRLHALADEMDLPYVRANLDRILTRTREGVQRVARIVHSLRGLARTGPAVFQDVQIPDLVESSLDMIRGRLRSHNIEVELDYGPAPKLRCVPTQLSQVLLNLLVNAAQAIESSGRDQGGRIHLTTRRDGEDILIEVADNGCGIDPDDLPRLYDPFFTTKPVGEGTGLGLSITHSIITGHSGRIDVESQPGVGTCFRVRLPLDPKRGPA